MVPAKVGIKCMGSGSANSAVSRSAALNPYGTRTSKGFPLFTEERLREKQLKVIDLTPFEKNLRSF